jgi:hypothetical protein
MGTGAVFLEGVTLIVPGKNLKNLSCESDFSTVLNLFPMPLTAQFPDNSFVVLTDICGFLGVEQSA